MLVGSACDKSADRYLNYRVFPCSSLIRSKAAAVIYIQDLLVLFHCYHNISQSSPAHPGGFNKVLRVTKDLTIRC